MNIRKDLTISMALAALALGLTTTQAKAQEPVLKGTFDLPAAAYWGDTLLQPGHYSFSLSTYARALAQVSTVHLSGEGVSKTFLSTTKPRPESGRSYLAVADMGGTYVVRAFEAGSLGKSFGFGVTKSVRNKTLRANAGPAMAVPVSAEAGL